MRRRIRRPEIRFSLDDPPRQPAVSLAPHQQLPQQLTRNNLGPTRKKFLAHRLARCSPRHLR
jgi:hypothetical protein